MIALVWGVGYVIAGVAVAYVAAYIIVALAATFLGIGYSWRREAKRHARKEAHPR